MGARRSSFFYFTPLPPIISSGVERSPPPVISSVPTPCHIERSRDISAALPLAPKGAFMRSLHSLRSCVPLVASEQSSSAVEMTYCVVLFRQNQNPFRPFVANHLPCRNKQTKKLVNPLGLAQNPRIFASVLIHIAFGFSYLVSVFLFHIELICLLERERGLQGCKPRSLFLIFEN